MCCGCSCGSAHKMSSFGARHAGPSASISRTYVNLVDKPDAVSVVVVGLSFPVLPNTPVLMFVFAQDWETQSRDIILHYDGPSLPQQPGPVRRRPRTTAAVERPRPSQHRPRNSSPAPSTSTLSTDHPPAPAKPRQCVFSSRSRGLLIYQHRHH